MRQEELQKTEEHHSQDTTLLEQIKDSVVTHIDTSVVKAPTKFEESSAPLEPSTIGVEGEKSDREFLDAYFSWGEFLLFAILLIVLYFLLHFAEKLLDFVPHQNFTENSGGQ